MSCLVACSFTHLFICLLSFWVASDRGNDFVNNRVELGYVAGERECGAERQPPVETAIWQHQVVEAIKSPLSGAFCLITQAEK